MHKSLRHERIVALLDIFEIDVITFANVVELCRGKNLDSHLNNHQVGAAVCRGISCLIRMLDEHKESLYQENF
jgi:serine/threonine protein kinase